MKIALDDNIKSFELKTDMINTRSCVIALLLITVGYSALQVYMPMYAVNEVAGLVNYTLANFGHIPYGRTIIGQIIIPQDQ